jgi:hypothetical protein
LPDAVEKGAVATVLLGDTRSVDVTTSLESAVADAVVTTSVTVAVWLREPLVPVIVSVELPIGVLVVVVTFIVALPEPVTEAGLNDADAPVGRPLTLRLTLPLKPFTAPMLTV